MISVKFQEVRTTYAIVVDPRIIEMEKLADSVQKIHPDYKVMKFQDPLLAVKFGVKHSVVALYTVVGMSRLDGFGVMRMLRKVHPDMLIFMIWTNEKWKRDAMRAGADGYLVEPLTVQKLQNMENQSALEWLENEEYNHE